MRKYLDKLISCLNAVSIRDNKSNLDLGFEDGMNTLLLLLLDKRRSNKNLYFIGNGGSAAIASHMTSDFFKNGRFKTISLFDSSALTCLGNDYGYEYIFSKQIERMMNPGDLLIAISSSGRSPNIVNAVNAAHENNADVLSFTGFDFDNTVRLSADCSVYIPSHEYGIVESCHNLLLQELVDKLKDIKY